MRAPSPRFLRLVDRTWDRLTEQGLTVHYLSRCLVGVYCPVCVTGTIAIQFIDSDPPQLDIYSWRGDVKQDGCTAGCPARDIAERLL